MLKSLFRCSENAGELFVGDLPFRFLSRLAYDMTILSVNLNYNNSEYFHYEDIMTKII